MGRSIKEHPSACSKAYDCVRVSILHPASCILCPALRPSKHPLRQQRFSSRSGERKSALRLVSCTLRPVSSSVWSTHQHDYYLLETKRIHHATFKQAATTAINIQRSAICIQNQHLQKLQPLQQQGKLKSLKITGRPAKFKRPGAPEPKKKINKPTRCAPHAHASQHEAGTRYSCDRVMTKVRLNSLVNPSDSWHEPTVQQHRSKNS